MKLEVLNGGFVELVRSMGGDASVVEAARVTSGTRASKKSPEQLIRYLMRHEHMSPFEFCQLEFHVRAPIYVARQWVRHRTASWNEVSGRYVEFEDGCQEQVTWRGQASVNRQGSDGEVDHEPTAWCSANDEEDDGRLVRHAEDVALIEYRKRIAAGVAREQARTCLPVSTWTEWRWSVDLRNLMHFLKLRTSAHAQPEIREYARVVEALAESVAPDSMTAWRDYHKNALALSVLDLRAIAGWPLDESPSKESLVRDIGMSEGEAAEHMEKRRIMVGGER